MNNGLNALLDSAFRDADKIRNAVEQIREQARKHPQQVAALIVEEIPEQRKRMREEIAASFGVDLSDAEELKGRYNDFSVEVAIVLQALNLYRALGECQLRIEAVVANTALSEEAQAARICELGVDVLHMQEANLLHTFHEIRKVADSHSDERGRRHAQEVEASHLAGHLATRISTQYSRLRKALDDIREYNKPAKRERFEALLRELFAHSPTIWADYHNDDLSLRVTRNVIVRQIEGHDNIVAPEAELTTFAAREAALKRAHDAGLTPRERELFKFFVENPQAKNAEAARALGIAEGTVSSLKSRIRKALHAA